MLYTYLTFNIRTKYKEFRKDEINTEIFIDIKYLFNILISGTPMALPYRYTLVT